MEPASCSKLHITSYGQFPRQSAGRPDDNRYVFDEPYVRPGSASVQLSLSLSPTRNGVRGNGTDDYIEIPTTLTAGNGPVLMEGCRSVILVFTINCCFFSASCANWSVLIFRRVNIYKTMRNDQIIRETVV